MTNTPANVSPIRSDGESVRAKRAQFVHHELKSKRWSIRQASVALGMSHTALGDRMNGNTAFLAEELEAIANLLERNPVEFYAEFIKVGPAGIEPTTSTVEYGRLGNLLMFERKSIKESA